MVIAASMLGLPLGDELALMGGMQLQREKKLG
jgi:hypothetical protein